MLVKSVTKHLTMTRSPICTTDGTKIHSLTHSLTTSFIAGKVQIGIIDPNPASAPTCEGLGNRNGALRRIR